MSISERGSRIDSERPSLTPERFNDKDERNILSKSVNVALGETTYKNTNKMNTCVLIRTVCHV